MKASLQEDFHSDNENNWIEELILDVYNLIDLNMPPQDVINFLLENKISNDMIYLILYAAKIYGINENTI